jgi:predicted restriction endonuclease
MKYEGMPEAERLNVHNGLLLSSLWDAAFDAGLVSFDDQGQVIPSASLSNETLAVLQIDDVPRLNLTDGHRQRLAWHRANVWVAG